MMGKAMRIPQFTTPERIVWFTVDMPESLHQKLSRYLVET
jgi:hypothetical protein